VGYRYPQRKPKIYAGLLREGDTPRHASRTGWRPTPPRLQECIQNRRGLQGFWFL